MERAEVVTTGHVPADKTLSLAIAPQRPTHRRAVGRRALKPGAPLHD